MSHRIAGRRVRRRVRRRSRLSRGQAACAAAAGIALAVIAGHAATSAAVSAAGPGGRGTGKAAAAAIAYARAQIGKPYLWGGAGPDAFDCSGLVMMAYASAGVALERTSQEQWATEPHIALSQVEPGDLVFFAGSDGTPASPGHVGLVVDPARHLMINAYMTGMPVLYATYGLPSSMGGLTDPVGFTDPTAGSN